jgi:RIO-like serine/threonine protein kinase
MWEGYIPKQREDWERHILMMIDVTKGSRFATRLETKPRNVLDDVLGCISKIVWIKLIAFGMASF